MDSDGKFNQIFWARNVFVIPVKAGIQPTSLRAQRGNLKNPKARRFIRRVFPFLIFAVEIGEN
jgi:hypothetical protein